MTTVKWRTNGGGEPRELDPLWRDAESLGWMPSPPARVIIHAPDAHENQLVVETARSLVTFLQSCTPSRPIEIVGSFKPESWPGVTHLDLQRQARYLVDVACLRDGARIPEAWFDDVFLVTIVAAAPDPRLGIRGVLAAQADLLDAPEALDLDAIFAAHRLLASSLCIACGTTAYGDATSGTWWAISRDDVALDRSVAWQAGAEADALPVFRHLERHESRRVSGLGLTNGAPQIRDYVAAPGQITLGRLGAVVTERSRRLVKDLQLSAQNIRRLPQFVERRMPGLARLWRAA